MSDWEQSKQDFVDKLSAAAATFNSVFVADPAGLVINGDKRKKLESLYKKSKNILQKLTSREFTVAIVGMENSGKSSLGNALIKSRVLPQYHERCTFTKTEIRAGEEDIAEVHFYSRAEFNENFRRMLSDVGYTEGGDFSTMTAETFNRYWAGVENDEANRQLVEKSDNEFKVYITGISGQAADAILLVTNVGQNPNLTGTQLDMLRKSHDADGIRLSAKAFVFGNKIDTAIDSTTAQNNLAALTRDAVERHQIALANHIVGGSASAYLEGLGLIDGNTASAKLAEWNFPDGLDTLHEKMRSYYDNERFEVLKQRAKNTLAEVQKTFREILDAYGSDDQSDSDFREKTLITR